MKQGIIQSPGFKYSAGIAYVAIPYDLDRAKYIKNCYANCKISMRTQDGGFHNNIPIPPEVLNFITFPEKVEQIGTPVVYITDQQWNHHYIVARFQAGETLGDGSENKFKFSRQLEGSHVEISGSAQDRAINILIDGGDKSGSFNVNLFNTDKDCKLVVDVQGDIEVRATGDVSITSQKTLTVTTVDENDNKSSFTQTANTNKFNSDKFVINDGEQAAVLGNKLEDFFGTFIDTLVGIRTADQKPLSPDSIAKINLLKAQVKQILSREVFIKQ